MATLHLNNQRVCVCDIKVKLVFKVSGLTGPARDESLQTDVSSALINTSFSQLVTFPPTPPPQKNKIS